MELNSKLSSRYLSNAVVKITGKRTGNFLKISNEWSSDNWMSTKARSGRGLCNNQASDSFTLLSLALMRMDGSIDDSIASSLAWAKGLSSMIITSIITKLIRLKVLTARLRGIDYPDAQPEFPCR